MKTTEEILNKHAGMNSVGLLKETALKAMEEYADQFKYDFSKECKCNDSPGSTWCCNLCGLPITPQREQ